MILSLKAFSLPFLKANAKHQSKNLIYRLIINYLYIFSYNLSNKRLESNYLTQWILVVLKNYSPKTSIAVLIKLK